MPSRERSTVRLTGFAERGMLEAFFRGLPLPTGFRVSLHAVAAAPPLARMVEDVGGEPVGRGYERQPLARSPEAWPSVERTPEGGYRLVSKPVSFGPARQGDWGELRGAALATAGGELIVPHFPFPEPRVVREGESIDVTLVVEPL